MQRRITSELGVSWTSAAGCPSYHHRPWPVRYLRCYPRPDLDPGYLEWTDQTAGYPYLDPFRFSLSFRILLYTISVGVICFALRRLWKYSISSSLRTRPLLKPRLAVLNESQVRPVIW